MISAERHAEYELERYRARRAEAIVLLGGSCAVCGSVEELEFDHIDPTTKSFNVSAWWSLARETFLAELSKCQLLCKPHHSEKSAKEIVERRGGVKHNRWRYTKYKCRCDDCRADYSVWRRERTIRDRAKFS